MTTTMTGPAALPLRPRVDCGPSASRAKARADRCRDRTGSEAGAATNGLDRARGMEDETGQACRRAAKTGCNHPLAPVRSIGVAGGPGRQLLRTSVADRSRDRWNGRRRVTRAVRAVAWRARRLLFALTEDVIDSAALGCHSVLDDVHVVAALRGRPAGECHNRRDDR